MPRSLRNTVFSHWRMKLLAGVLAASAWLVSSGRDYTPVEGQPVTLRLTPPRDGVILQANAAPYTGAVHFSVDLYGPRGNIEMLAGKMLVAEHSFDNIDVTEIEEGMVLSQTVDLESVRIRLEDGDLPKAIEVHETYPKQVEVKIDRVSGSPAIPVEAVVEYMTEDGSSKEIAKVPPPTEEGCAEGYQITSFFPTPGKVRVLGPASVVKQLKKVRAQPARIGDLRGDFYRTVRIDPYVEHAEYGPVKISSSDLIDINIKVAELAKTRTLKSVPVHILEPAKFWLIVDIKEINGQKVDPKDPRADLEIRGPDVDISEEHVKVFLDVAGAGVGDSEKVLDVWLPEGIRLGGPPPVASFTIKPTTAPD